MTTTPSFYLIHCLDAPAKAQIRQQHAEAHKQYMQAHKAQIALGGPLLAEDHQTRIGSFILLQAPHREQAEQFLAAEPYTQAGVFERVIVRPFQTVMWNADLLGAG